MALSAAERKVIADTAIREAEIAETIKNKDWQFSHNEQQGIVVVRMGSVDQHPDRFVAELMVDSEMWKRRAEQHGCDTENGDDDCG